MESNVHTTMNTYTFDKYLATQDTVKEVLNQYGVAIIPSLLNEEECQEMNQGMWDTLGHLTQTWETPIRKENPNSWREMRKLYPSHSMLMQHWSVGHAQYIWNLRQHPKIIHVFAHLWKCDPHDLLVSFDGVSYHMPPEITGYGWDRGKHWFHTDQSYLSTDFQCAQGWITGYNVDKGDATLAFLEGSHKYHAELQQRFQINDKKNWFKLNEEHMHVYVNEYTCIPVRIQCPAGSLVVWDSRTIHCGIQSLKERPYANFRNIAYLCYQPRSHTNAKLLAKKRKALNEMRMTSHWPGKVTLFPKYPQTYGQPLPEVTSLPVPVLNADGLRLAGY